MTFLSNNGKHAAGAKAKKEKGGPVSAIRNWYLQRLKSRLQFKEEKLKLRERVQRNTNSLLWVWEFSKKAVLICFGFYIIVQVYAMAVMVKHYDFTYLGSLIDQTGQITRDCVFAYLVKAGLENIGKIWFNHKNKGRSDEDGPVG